MFGYHGCYVRINLTEGRRETLPLSEATLRKTLGGVGLGTWLLQHESAPHVPPLAPEAPLVFALSPLVGTPLTTSAKFAMVARSPLTERLNDSLSSSHFALAAKRSGCDALVLIGACAVPSVLILDEDSFRIEPADDLWGLSAGEASRRLRDRLGEDFASIAIGIAGENLVRFATLSHGNRHGGRGGLGAIMGAKKLKALAITGKRRVPLADPVGVGKAARELSRASFGPATAKYRELGTVSNLLTFNRLSALPTRNFQQGTFEGAEALSGEALNASRKLSRASCAACTIGCEHIFASPAGPVRLEYETLFALGPLCGIGDADAVLEAAHRCDHLGLDTISAGATVAFAMECTEKGYLQREGIVFGDHKGLLLLLEQIAQRQGLGAWLADGTRWAAATLGPEAQAIAPHVKGLELPGYEPRALQAMALGFAVGTRGADHNRSGAYEIDFSPKADRLHGSPEAARLAAESEDRAALLDSLILCKFLRGVFGDLYAETAALLRLVTGWEISGKELQGIARDIVNRKKAYNIREGWTPAEDTLPDRFFHEPLSTGLAAGASFPKERLEEMKVAYYTARGWTANGGIPPETLARLEREAP